MGSETLKTQDKELLPFEIGYMPEFVLKKAEEELNETAESKIKGIQELRSLLRKNSETKEVLLHDDVLVAYLRRSKYRVNGAHQQIQNFIRLRKKKDNLANGIPDAFLDLPSSKFLALLPMRCQDGCLLAFIRWGKWDPMELPMEGLQQMITMALNVVLHDPVTQINGVKVIHDFQGISFKHVRYLTPHNIHLLYHGAMNCFPLRCKAVHSVHDSALIRIGWSIMMALLTQKMRSRIFFHSSGEELLNFFPRSVLPTQFGGSIRDEDLPDWARRVNKDIKKYTILGQSNYY
ncbi:alpha-tocopherol transfer protein-like [Argiope bruennichi]|uniref:alpha-tocopherol transfer protein-like n=1 Tax=Argiope bruennichi TaxID=94029 RepID=UPI0024956584|nr:alpha-tocopherol transfer protein-like [Argiope bruennichi]XP_055943731.1 alpha-tocopherol transfer protein-like [Argiope bruennichi]XP_055943732.1 alpha-tocopherol transfer protein-like [Argiope bruennichi]XP_055943733.1 alpha-tocopherol transfer protein-like [Argiope bruennichi]XP_055943734.1 alpha-tocopherol transfer protein-like [Argiope bruennichi]XP_055943735.1 alpha-tocopherol transfer protein-like [Argiope bruennichi]XP_055943737.1 alpha-tocopherol transfer protein-like [Argiope br